MAFDNELDQMKIAVAAAEDEIVMAVMFHETWRPTAYDEGLHNRMGNSFATHSFQIVRLSLRREMLLALMRHGFRPGRGKTLPLHGCRLPQLLTSWLKVSVWRKFS